MQPHPTGFAPVPILPAGFAQVSMAQPVAEPLTSSQKASPAEQDYFCAFDVTLSNVSCMSQTGGDS